MQTRFALSRRRADGRAPPARSPEDRKNQLRRPHKEQVRVPVPKPRRRREGDNSRLSLESLQEYPGAAEREHRMLVAQTRTQAVICGAARLAASTPSLQTGDQLHEIGCRLSEGGLSGLPATASAPQLGPLRLQSFVAR